MHYEEVQQGRVFVLRLEHGEIVHRSVERFAAEQGIGSGALIALGGADAGSQLVTGPKEVDQAPIIPLVRVLEAVHEVAGVGTLFPDESGRPVLHMHMACGREDRTSTGCIRSGVAVWQTLEIVLFEIRQTAFGRRAEERLGINLLQKTA